MGFLLSEFVVTAMAKKKKPAKQKKSKKKVESIVKISNKQLKSLVDFVDGYIGALVAHNVVEDIWDDWCSYGDEWDVNIHALDGVEAGSIYVDVHPMSRNREGYQETEMSRHVRIGVWRKNKEGQWRMTVNSSKLIRA